MKSFIKIAIISASILTGVSSCTKKENPTPVVENGQVYMEFFNKVGAGNLQLNTQWYMNANGDSFTVSKLNYYISNVVLNGSTGTDNYTEPESYHLIEHSPLPSEMTFNMATVPGGKYKSVTFTIGVDSLRNVSGAQTGALDPALGNFWTWNTGYIMLKFEGSSPKSTTPDNKVFLHAGGFSGENSVLRTVTLNFPTEIEVTKNKTPHIHVEANVLKMLNEPNVIDFAATSVIHMPGTDAKKLADNYAGMFSITFAGL